MADQQRRWIATGRATWIALALTAILSAVLIAWPWFRYSLTSISFSSVVVGLLSALEIAYLLTAVLSLAGLAIVLIRSRAAPKDSGARGLALRGLLAVFAGLLAVATAELTAAGWQAWEDWSAARSLARSGLRREVTLPTAFPEAGPPDELNLVVLGESSAVGYPCREWLNIGKVVAWKLGETIPGRRFHVELIAHEGDTLELQHRKLAGLRRRPDAILVYCGHNEFAARYGPNHASPHYADRRGVRHRSSLDLGLLRWSPFCRLLRRVADRHRVGVVPAIGAHRPLVDAPVYDAADQAERVADFRGRLERIVAYSRQVGALPILLIPPGNDAGFEPNRSYLAPETPAAERDAFAREFLDVRSAEEAEPAASAARYRTLLTRQPTFAEAHFRLARLLERAGRWGEAYEHYVAARDLDGLPVRCPTALQDIYRDVAMRHDALLVDGQALFHEIGTHGLLDDRLCHDAMHPSVRGHIALAEAVLKALHARRAFGWPAGASPPSLDPAATAAHFGIDAAAWKALCERAAMFYYGFLGARYEAAERTAKHETYLDAALRIAAGASPESLGLPSIGFAGDNRSAGTGASPSTGMSRDHSGRRDGRHDEENIRR